MTWVIRVLRVLRKTIVWGVLTLICLFLAALAINAVDEQLGPEALTMLQPPKNTLRPEENIYFAMVGFDAPSGQSVVTEGGAKIDHYNGQVDAMLHDPFLELQDYTSKNPAALEFTGSTDLGMPREPSFWAATRANGPKIVQLINQNRELYERYTALHEMTGYFETARPSVLAPFATVSSEVRTLFLANASFELQQGSESQKRSALEGLRQDIDLWRRVLIGDGGPISKMVAVSYLQTDYLILSNLIADPSTSIPPSIEEILPPSDLGDWNIGSVFAAEFRVQVFILKQTQEVSRSGWQPPDTSGVQRSLNTALWGPVGRQFFKITATENLSARLMHELAKSAAMTPATFAAQRARYRRIESENTDFLRLGMVYNPIGKILMGIAAPAYEDYALRPYDAAALERLVRLSFEIRRQQIVPAAIPAFMAQHSEWSTHPADGRSFTWNAKAAQIAIHPVAKQPVDRRFSVRIWQKP